MKKLLAEGKTAETPVAAATAPAAEPVAEAPAQTPATEISTDQIKEKIAAWLNDPDHATLYGLAETAAAYKPGAKVYLAYDFTYSGADGSKINVPKGQSVIYLGTDFDAKRYRVTDMKKKTEFTLSPSALDTPSRDRAIAYEMKKNDGVALANLTAQLGTFNIPELTIAALKPEIVKTMYAA